MEKLKVNNLVGVVPGSEKVFIYSNQQSSNPEALDYDDLYDGFFKSIPSTFVDCEIHVMYPWVRNNENYLYIHIVR